MLAEILRFNRLATDLARRQAETELATSIGDFLDAHGFGPAFREDYLLPMIGCIWSCPTDQMLRFPVATLIRFCHNHGLIQVTDRPQWYTVRGGSRQYVRRLVAQLPDARLNTPVLGLKRLDQGVVLQTAHGSEHFDAVVLACHSDQALALLGEDASADERAVLGAIRYQPNEAVLHTDTGVLPTRPAAWAAWNYERAASAQEQTQVCLHYLINRLQPLPWERPVIVSLNPARPIDERQVHQRIATATRCSTWPPSRPSAACRPCRGGAHLVLRRLVRLRLPRGRPARRHRCRRQPAPRAGRLARRGRHRPGGRMSATPAAAQPLIGFGSVWHRRLRPVEHAFRYPSYFLLLPLRSLRATPHAALRRNRWGWLSFHDRDHGEGGPTRWPGSRTCWRARASRRRRRGLAAHLPARAGLCLQAGELLVRAPGRWLAGRRAGRGQQHLRRAPRLPAGRPGPGLGPRAACPQGLPRLALLPGRGAYRFRFERHAAMRSTAPHPGAGGPGRRPGPAAADQRGRPARGPEPGQRAPGLLRHPADDPGRDRPHPLAGAALWRKRVPFFGKPAAPEHFVTR
jgi:hypothetical protein